MTIELDDDLDQTLADLVKGGRFSTPKDALREALGSLHRETERQARMDQLRAKVQVAVDQMDRGEGLDAESVFDELMAGLPDPDSVP